MGICFLLPGFFGTVCFALAPFCRTVVRSFQNALGTAFVGLENYRMVLGNTAFQIAAGNTLRFTLVCIPLLVAGSLVLSVVLQRQTYIKNGLKSMFLVPAAVPAASVVLVWKLLFHSNGLLNRALLATAGGKVEWMTTSASFWVLVLSYLWKNLGYDMILWMAGLAGIPEEILKANPDTCVRIPMIGETRSLNLSNSVAIVLYEALRQNEFDHMKLQGELHRLRWED